MPDFGVYVHFPWCRSRCAYCDFPIAVDLSAALHRRYLQAVESEFAHRAPAFAGNTLRSIYIGGGTPSLWDPDCLARLVAIIAERFGADIADLEVTLETNPADCDDRALPLWRSAGINRLSIGVQSDCSDTLRSLGRDPAMGDGPAAMERVGASGFAQLSVDLLFGSAAGATVETTLQRLREQLPSHLSVYELTVHTGTPLATQLLRGDIALLSEDQLASTYQRVHEILQSWGYEHYEISSYAQPGHRAVHNSLYWCGASYLGLGNGAASFLRSGSSAVRWVNHRSVRRYLALEGSQHQEQQESLTADELRRDLLWLGLRTADGVPVDWFRNRERVRDGLVRDALARQQGDRIVPTFRGFLFADQVAQRIVRDAGYD